MGHDSLVGPWVCSRTGGAWKSGVTIGLESGGDLVAGVVFDDWNGRSIVMSVASEKAHWLTRGFLRVVFAYAFKQMGAQKLLGFVDSENQAARRFDEHLGFQREAVISGAGPRGDILIYSMTPAQCRYLGARDGT